MRTPLNAPRSELARVTLSVLFIGGLIAGALWILSPFLPALIWATMIVVATWPLLMRAQHLFGGRRGPAVALMCLVLVVIFLVPLGLAIQALLAHTDDIPELVKRFSTVELPRAPDWLVGLPLVGKQAADAWNRVADAGAAELVARAQPYARDVAAWFAHRAGNVALVTLQFLLVVILSAVLYSGGEAWGGWIKRFGRRLAGEQGERMVVLAGQAIRAVALGVVVTAVVQTVLGGIGVAVAGVPFASVLTALMFALCIAQIGPLLVLLGATVWVYMHAGAGWGTVMLIWSVAVGVLDNFLRPVLIRRGADLPLLLIFAGVIGGLVSFGIVGLFVGPVVLAVAYTLLDDWVAARDPVSAENLARGG